MLYLISITLKSILSRFCRYYLTNHSLLIQLIKRGELMDYLSMTKKELLAQIKHFEKYREECTRLKKALQEKDIRYKILTEQTGNIIFFYDYTSRKMEWFGAVKSLTGYTLSSFAIKYRKQWRDLIHPEDIQRMIDIIEDARKRMKKYSVGYRFLHKSGEYRYFEEDGIFYKMGKSATVYAIGTVRDVTEKVEAENALKESEKKYRNFIQNSTEGIWRIEVHKPIPLSLPREKLLEIYIKESYIAECNDNFARMYGYEKAEDVIGMSPFKFQLRTPKRIWNKNRAYDARWEEYVKSGLKTVNGETYEKDRYGKRKFILNNSSGIIENGMLLGVWGTQIDVTSIREAEEQKKMQERQMIQTEKMATLGTLATGIAHEINNPNNFMMLNADILKRAWSDIEPILKEHYSQNGDFLLAGLPYSESFEKIGQLISGLSEGSRRIKQIVDGLKNFAVADSGEMNESVDIAKAIDSSVLIVHNMLKRSTNNFSEDIEDTELRIKGNQLQIEQVIINLLTNACQSLPSPDKSISVKAFKDKKGSSVIIEISDQGIGISKEHLKHICDPFFTTKRDIGGTGLGLSISYSMIKNHNGSMTFTSKKGEGTTVRITLPFYKGAK